jgi:cytochrome c556
VKFKSKFVLAVLCAAVSSAAFAGKDEDQQIKFRQSAYSFTAWNCSKIKSQVVDHPETFNKEQVIAAANSIAAVANSGLGALYGPGTDQGTGWKKTRLKPEFFEKQDEVKKVALSFNEEANKLAKVAANGDIGEIKTQFGELGKACKSCHDKFRIKDE